MRKKPVGAALTIARVNDATKARRWKVTIISILTVSYGQSRL